MQKGAKLPFFGNIVEDHLPEILIASVGLEPMSRATILLLPCAFTTSAKVTVHNATKLSFM